MEKIVGDITLNAVVETLKTPEGGSILIMEATDLNGQPLNRDMKIIPVGADIASFIRTELEDFERSVLGSSTKGEDINPYVAILSQMGYK